MAKAKPKPKSQPKTIGKGSIKQMMMDKMMALMPGKKGK